MKNRKILLPALLSISLVFSLILTASVMAQEQVTPMVAAGNDYTVGLKANGTVVAVGENEAGQCDVDGWRGIIQVAAGIGHTVGLKANGTVVAVGCNDFTDPYFGDVVRYQFGQCDVGGWTDIIQVAAGANSWHTVGVKSDGTVIAVGDNQNGQCDVGNWIDIVQVAAGTGHTVGLKSDGTVVATVFTSAHGSYQWDAGNWSDITQVTAGHDHTVGLKSDGIVVAVGNNDRGQCDVGNWTDIIQVAAGGVHTVGLNSDGTVVAMGYNGYGQLNVGGWTDIVQVAAGSGRTVGLKSDGTVVAVGFGSGSELAKWNLLLAVPPMNWPLVGGIIAAVVAAGLVIFLVRRKKTG